MALVLGIDAAWTTGQPSGVALLDAAASGAMCLVAAPSYAAFLAQANGQDIDWQAAQAGGEAPLAELLAASERLAGRAMEVIAVDMPVSRQAISGRREADQAVSREFGGRWCAAHSPNSNRPGALGERLSEACLSCGYPLATTATALPTSRRLLEVYPHPAMLALLQREKRVPYKVSRAARYWPTATPAQRRANILAELRAIAAGLEGELGPLPITIPSDADRSARVLKTYEDTLDAVISAWVGWLYLQGKAVPLGDEHAAIWCPRSVVRQPGDFIQSCRAVRADF